jgi:excisionase family DNA binding protein
LRNPEEHDNGGRYLRFELPDDLINEVAARAAALVRSRPESEPWIGVADAAAHLACPASRIYALVSARRIPFRKDGSRLLFRRTELDVWIRDGGAVRP